MPAEQLEKYKKWLSKEPQIGDKFVIIDAKWLEHWKRFVGLEESHEQVVTDPGEIDFTKLAVQSKDNHPQNIQLRADAVEGNDYTFIPYELFENLLETHKKNGTEIVRKAVKQGNYFDVVIETFLVPLRLRESRAANAKCRQIYRSRRTKLEDLKKTICNEFNILETSNHYLYASTNEQGSNWEVIDEPFDAVLEDIDLIKDAYIIYESKPLAIRSANSSRTLYVQGLCGLTNLGNTCFMNSALQCLSNVPELTKYFFDDEYREHINRNNPLGMKGDVAQAYGELIHEMWSGKTSYCAPKSLKHNVARYAPQFSGYAQQDSQEFMSFLLDGLHEDLNLVKQKPYVEKKDDDGTLDDAALAAQDWEYYRKRNQSKIHELFHGQIKSVVQCLTCQTKARTFDPICFLSLPLPNKKKIRTYKIDYVRINGQIKSYHIKIDEHSRVSNLVDAFCSRFQPKEKKTNQEKPMDIGDQSESKDAAYPDENNEEDDEEDLTKAADFDGHQPKPDYILSAEVYNHRIHLQYNDNTPLTRILDRDQIVFFEVPDPITGEKKENILMPCTFREGNYRQNFGLPIYLSVPRNNCTGKHVQDALQKAIGNFFPLSSVKSSDKPLYTASLQTSQNYHQQLKLLSNYLDEPIDFGRMNVELVVEVSSTVVDLYKKQQEDRREEDEKNQRLLNENNNRKDGQPKRVTTLLDCFRYFTTKETLSDNDLWSCPNCKQLKKATKKFDLWLLPKILIVQLKRFNYTRYYRDKIDTFIDCPLRELDLSQFVLNSSEKSTAKYDLIGVSNHMGGLGGGHYTAHAKNSVDRKWHSFDDSYVSDISEDSVISKAAYVLIYQQKTQTN